MSEPRPKYVTFRDLHTATPNSAEKLINQPSPELSPDADLPSDLPISPSHDSSNSGLAPQLLPSSTSISSTSSTTSTTLKKGPLQRFKKPLEITESAENKLTANSEATAPSRDFQRVPNSVVRNALSEGTFRGKSKQVWDYLWSVSRGSIIPVRQIRKSRREIQKGAGLGSMVTVDAAIQHLEEVGLIKVRQSVGSLQGNTYEVFTPEEINPRYTSSTRSSRSTSLTQNLVHLDILDSGISSTTQVSENSTTYGLPKTFFKTDDETDDDDTHTGEQFFAVLREAANEVCGGISNRSEQEKERWRELGELLAEELKSAAARATSVSSPPAFFAAHLRRVLKKQRTSNRIKGKISRERNPRSPQPETEVTEVTSPTKGVAKSIYSFEERRRYASNQQPSLGNGWIVDSGIGKYDEVVGAWLKEQNGEQEEDPLVNAAACPDCRGTGMYYPGGFEKGAAKCRHERLAASKD